MNPKKSFDKHCQGVAPHHILNVPTRLVGCTTVQDLLFESWVSLTVHAVTNQHDDITGLL